MASSLPPLKGPNSYYYLDLSSEGQSCDFVPLAIIQSSWFEAGEVRILTAADSGAAINLSQRNGIVLIDGAENPVLTFAEGHRYPSVYVIAGAVAKVYQKVEDQVRELNNCNVVLKVTEVRVGGLGL